MPGSPAARPAGRADNRGRLPGVRARCRHRDRRRRAAYRCKISWTPVSASRSARGRRLARRQTGSATNALHPGWTLVTCILASSLAFIDGSVVNVALPAIGRSLGGGAADLQWTMNAYTLPLSALLLMGGTAGDHYGRRRFLLVGIGLFL